MTDAPKRIWIERATGQSYDFPPQEGETADIYVRADIADEMLAALEAILEAGDAALPKNPVGDGSWFDTIPLWMKP